MCCNNGSVMRWFVKCKPPFIAFNRASSAAGVANDDAAAIRSSKAMDLVPVIDLKTLRGGWLELLSVTFLQLLLVFDAKCGFASKPDRAIPPAEASRL